MSHPLTMTLTRGTTLATLAVPLDTYTKLIQARATGRRITPAPGWPAVRIRQIGTIGVIFHRSPKIVVTIEHYPSVTS